MQTPLEEMIPLRSEVAGAVLNGTDCIMLSGVTASGSHLETAVQTMSMICKKVEDFMNYRAVQKKIIRAVPKPVVSHMERPVISVILKGFPIINPKVIIVLPKSGYKAELVAKYRPNAPILSVVDPECPEPARVASRGLVYRGIFPLIGAQAFNSRDEEMDFAVQVAREEGIYCGVPNGRRLSYAPACDCC